MLTFLISDLVAANPNFLLFMAARYFQYRIAQFGPGHYQIPKYHILQFQTHRSFLQLFPDIFVNSLGPPGPTELAQDFERRPVQDKSQSAKYCFLTWTNSLWVTCGRIVVKKINTGGENDIGRNFPRTLPHPPMETITIITISPRHYLLFSDLSTNHQAKNFKSPLKNTP